MRKEQPASHQRALVFNSMHAQLCLTLCDPSVSSVHGISQARILDWVVISSSRGIFLTQRSNLRLLRLLHWQADSVPLSHLGTPLVFNYQIFKSWELRKKQ